ncbi:MAG: hypothetical protein OER97_05525 [Gammaproteobacteria bacterium]|nr:hypothetical protein [Gammaproteobacteria bacterium]
MSQKTTMRHLIEKFEHRKRQASILAFIVVAWICFLLSSSTNLLAANAASKHQFFEDGVLISLQEPSLAIDVDDAFTFVGRHPFTIRDVAAGERFIFVDSEGDVILRLFIVQFEGFLPGIDNFYRYNLTESPVVANYPFRSNGYAFDIVEAVAANPKSESAATYPFLQSKGYSIPAHWMMWRSLTIADQARKKEMILFYVENVDSSGLSLDDFYEQDAATAAWIRIQKDLELRANNSFQLTELNENGEPNASAWSSIPSRF